MQKNMSGWKAWVEKHEILIFVILGVILLRLPNFYEPYWYGDEGIYLTVGQAMRHGSALYAQIIDHKTPIIYWLSYLVGDLTGLKFLLLTASIASIILFAKLAKKFFNGWAYAISLVAFALLTTLPHFEGNIANGELLLMPFTLLGMWLWWKKLPTTKIDMETIKAYVTRQPWWWPILIGVSFGISILTKVPAGFDLAALGVVMILGLPQGFKKRVRTDYVRYGILIIAGAVSTIGLSVIYFLVKGTLSSYVDFGLLYNFRYIEAWNASFSNPVALFLASMLGRILLLAIFLAGVTIYRKKLSLPLRFSLYWFGMTLFAALLSLRPYPHYFMQVMPAASLLIGFIISNNLLGKIMATLPLVLGLFILQALHFAPYPTMAYYQRFWLYMTHQISTQEYEMRFDANTPGTYAIAKWIDDHTDPAERIFIWGNEPMIYSLADRSPVGRFTVAFHIESFGAYDETMQTLMTQKPTYIIDTLKDRASFPKFYDYLQTHYLSVATVDRGVIYRRADWLQQQ